MNIYKKKYNDLIGKAILKIKNKTYFQSMKYVIKKINNTKNKQNNKPNKTKRMKTKGKK